MDQVLEQARLLCLKERRPLLIVKQTENGEIEAYRDGDTGMYVVGRGATVAEAVGMWCIYSQRVTALCYPDPTLIETRFRIHPEKKRDKRRYKAADRRD